MYILLIAPVELFNLLSIQLHQFVYEEQSVYNCYRELHRTLSIVFLRLSRVFFRDKYHVQEITKTKPTIVMDKQRMLGITTTKLSPYFVCLMSSRVVFLVSLARGLRS